jgi:hypothetical protein
VVVALAQAALAAVQKGEQGWMRVGGINVDGRINWLDEAPRQRIRFVTVRVDRDGKELPVNEEVR